MTAPPVTLSPTGTTRTGSVARTVAIDAAFMIVLLALGLFGFRSSYGGTEYLEAGMIGALLGMAVAEIARRLRQPVLMEGVVTVVIFLLIGGALAASSDAIGGVIPSATALSALVHAATSGWKELLTTAPPVGNTSHLLAIPYLIGLVGGVAGLSIATRTRSAPAPLLAPVGVLALGILFGTNYPASLLLQGSVFGAVALGWIVVRSHRLRTMVTERRRSTSRAALSVSLVAASTLLALVIGPHLPGAGSNGRVVLSRYVVPPFNASDQPSPLASFRRYTQGSPSSQYNAELFRVSGLQPGARVPIATMDEYSGLVWGFGAGSAASEVNASGDAFRRYGSAIPAPEPGASRAVTVHIGDLGGPWMPEVGQPTEVTFSGRNAAALTAGYLYDSATTALVEPLGLQEGETYGLDVVVPPTPSQAALSGAAPAAEQLAIGSVPTVLQTDATKWVGSATGAWAKVMAIANHFKTIGRYSNGTENPPLSLPGHSAGRLATFLDGGPLVGQQIVGDDEQYAATLALMANAIGVPARVVLGADVERGGVVRGKDVHAWVEVAFNGFGWVPIYQNEFLPTVPAQHSPPSSTPNSASSTPVEPPVSSDLRSPPSETLAGSSATSLNRFGPGSGFHIPGFVLDILEGLGTPLLVLAAGASVIIGLKIRRRRTRRSASAASSRIAGAWNELVDAARDIGRAVPNGKTRREQAFELESVFAPDLARRADAAVFSPGDPSSQQVDDYWDAVDLAARDMRKGLSRIANWRASLSLRSLLTNDGELFG